MRAAASSTSASGARITGDLPPSSRVTGVRCSAAAAMTFFPTAGLPVKKITSKGLSTRASASSRPPSATVIYSGGNTRPSTSARARAEAGASSPGFTTAVDPAAMADTRGARVRNRG